MSSFDQKACLSLRLRGDGRQDGILGILSCLNSSSVLQPKASSSEMSVRQMSSASSCWRVCIFVFVVSSVVYSISMLKVAESSVLGSVVCFVSVVLNVVSMFAAVSFALVVFGSASTLMFASD